MSVVKQTASRQRADNNADQEDSESYTDVFHGIKAAVTIALIVFWIPLVALYLIFGWRYVAVYVLTVMVAAACLFRLRFPRRHSISKETRRGNSLFHVRP